MKSSKTHFLLLAGFLLLGHTGLFAQKSEFPPNRQSAVKAVMKDHVSRGIPGLALTVWSPDTGYWSHAEGVANLETGEALTNDHLFYLQSVSKTYMAVVILKLMEQGKLQLEDPLLDYVQLPWLSTMEGADKITIRMLLNHTSGLPEYSTDPELVSTIIHDPLRVWTPIQMLETLKGKTLDFEPGVKYAYRNTNYELLSLIADKLTGDHQAYMEKHIFKKLRLENTHILNQENYQQVEGIVSAYWDLLLERKPVNVSQMQRANVASMKGDDGMVSTTQDAVLFLQGLASGKLLKGKTLELMQEWVNNADGKPVYGLGVTYYDLDITYGIGHSGGGIGAGCILLYLPEAGAIVFLATNFNTMLESPLRKDNEDLQMNILQALFTD